VEALEELDMILVTNEQLQSLERTIPEIAAMLDSLNKGAVIANNKRMHAAISFTAEERYEDLARTHPHFFSTVSPKHDCIVSRYFAGDVKQNQKNGY
jgi:hypothetical protein